MNINQLRPSELGIFRISYKEIFNGKINGKVPMTLCQQGLLKAYQEICSDRGSDNFIPVNPKKMVKKLRTTTLAPFIPEGTLAFDVKIMIDRGWFERISDSVIFTDFAKESLKNLN